LGVFEVSLREKCLSCRLELRAYLTVNRRLAENDDCFLDERARDAFVFIDELVCIDLAVAARAVKSVSLVPQHEVDIAGVGDM